MGNTLAFIILLATQNNTQNDNQNQGLYITIGLIVLVAIIAIYYYIQYKNNTPSEETNEHLFDFFPGLFPTIGIFTTVVGITYGLCFFDKDKIDESITNLLEGLKLAFIGTVLGMLGLIGFSIWNAIKKHRIEQREKELNKNVKSNEVLAIEQLIGEIKTLRKDLSDTHSHLLAQGVDEIKALRKDLSHTNEQGYEVSLGNAIRDIYNSNKKQEDALQSFAEDLALKIDASFEAVMNNEDTKMLAELKEIKTGIESLSDKLKSPAEDMTKSIADNLERSISNLIEEFKTSIKGETQTEMNNLVNNLVSVSQSLQSFPETIKTIQGEMAENFRVILDNLKGETLSATQELGEQNKQQVEQITIQTQQFNDRITQLLDTFNQNMTQQNRQQTEQITTQTQQFNDRITQLLDTISKTLSENVSSQQQNQKSIIEEQTKNLKASSQLLSDLQKGLTSMDTVVQSINSNIEALNQSHHNLKGTTDSFQNITNRIDNSSTALGSQQETFIEYSNEFLKQNKENISEIGKSLNTAKDVSADYAEKFEVIESGLKGIFEQISKGLQDYETTVKNSLEQFLNEYSNNLTKGVEALSSAISEQNEMIEELNDIVSKIQNNQ